MTVTGSVFLYTHIKDKTVTLTEVKYAGLQRKTVYLYP